MFLCEYVGSEATVNKLVEFQGFLEDVKGLLQKLFTWDVQLDGRLMRKCLRSAFLDKSVYYTDHV